MCFMKLPLSLSCLMWSLHCKKCIIQIYFATAALDYTILYLFLRQKQTRWTCFSWYKNRQKALGGCFYYRKCIWQRPLTPYNLQGSSIKLLEGAESKWDNKHVIYFYRVSEDAAYWARGRDEGEEERSNKEGDLYGGGSPLSHVIPMGADRSPQVIFPHREDAAAAAPSTSADNGPLPSFFCLTPTCITTHSHTALFGVKRLQQTLLNVIQRGSRDDLQTLWKAVIFYNNCNLKAKTRSLHAAHTHRHMMEVTAVLLPINGRQGKQERTWQDICPNFQEWMNLDRNIAPLVQSITVNRCTT